MQPIDAFNETHGRAMRFLRFHDGLINTRQRSVRGDWKLNFCRLMRWRLNSDIERVDSNDAVIVLRDGASLTPDDFMSDALDDMLRVAITYGVSALDRYVHERIVKKFVTAFRSTNLTKQQRDFQLPATLAIDIVRRVHAARTSDTSIRPANEIRNVVQEVLHRRPFQSWREIEYAFCLIGVKNLGKALREENGLDQAQLKNIQTSLNRIIERRNHIVHEGDLPRHQRGGLATVKEIRRNWVEDSLVFIEDLVGKLEAVK